MPDARTLAGAARAAEGIPQELSSAGGAGPTLALPDILAALKSGQFSPEALMQFLAMLMGSGQVAPTQTAQPASPIESAYLE